MNRLSLYSLCWFIASMIGLTALIAVNRWDPIEIWLVVLCVIAGFFSGIFFLVEKVS